MIKDFTYEEYKKALELMKMHNNVIPFNAFSSECDECQLILRHDVDFSIKKAMEIADIEMDKGIRSTFFVMVTNEHYNVLDKENSRMLKDLIRNGFEIGLHFDPMVYAEDAFQDALEFELAVLEKACKAKIDSVSLHNPSISGLWPSFSNIRNAYDKRWFADSLYISDSSKNFRGKNLESFVKDENVKVKQVLLHPIHFSNIGEAYVDAIFSLEKKKMSELHRNMMKYNKTYKTEYNNKMFLGLESIYVDFFGEQ